MPQQPRRTIRANRWPRRSALLEPTYARYELALALADLGGYLRRTGRNADARDPLRRALDLARRTGAAPLAEQTRRELLAAGARPRRTALTGPDALTSSERQVAGLAADGRSQPGKSPSTCSSPRPRWKPTCGTPPASLVSPHVPTCPHSCPATATAVSRVWEPWGMTGRRSRQVRVAAEW